MDQNKWDKRMMDAAQFYSTWSKDPSTQVGSVIARGKHVVSYGYNGLPEGIEDTYERLNNRELKYPLVIHAEQNTILKCNENVSDCTLYVYPLPPCSRCCTWIIQKGIKRIVCKHLTKNNIDRWGGDDHILAMKILSEAKVTIIFL